MIRKAVLILVGATRLASAQAGLSNSMRASVDSAVRAVLAHTGAPSASIAIVKDGAIVYANAYGTARIAEALPASPTMQYSIGSISKQFTATCILLLAERHKLSLDDKVSRWFPQITRSKDISVRQLLSMTSGIRDFWPQDYVMPPMLQPITAQKIVEDWARSPLDFEPGAQYQYSNTNYVIAGLIVEKASGLPFVTFLRQNILTPLHLESAFITDEGALPATDPERYERFGLGPPRVAPKEGRGWLYAAGELAMNASDLARWDISVINRTILTPASYRIQQTNAHLNDGRAISYGLGVVVASFNGHREISHGGEVSGFTTQNAIYPDDRMAIVALTNLFASDAPGDIKRAIAKIIFADTTDAATDAATARAKQVLAGFQKGRIDRSLFTPNANAYFSAQALTDLSASLGNLGDCSSVVQAESNSRGGFKYRGYRATCGSRELQLSTYLTPAGVFEQFIVTP